MGKTAYRLVYYLIPGLLLVLSVLIFNFGQIFLRWSGVGEQLTGMLDRVGAEAVGEQWEAADGSVEEVRRLWERTRPRVMVSYGMEEMEMLDETLAELQGAVEARDAGQVQIVHRRTQAMWQDLNP